MKKLIIAALLAALSPALWSSAALAIEDTPENRAAQVDHYLTVVPPESLFNDVTEKVAKTMPPDQRAAFVAMLTKHLDLARFNDAMRAALIKWFTADEMAAMSEFYGSPAGKSIMKKMGDYMAELMPTMQQELAKAMQATQAEMMLQKK